MSPDLTFTNLDILKEKVKIISAKLKARHEMLGFAESCTGGQLSTLFVSVPGISEIYQGSIVSYSYESKINLLGVEQKILESLGAVSEEVALAMSRGALKALRAQWVIAVTGIAGPGGGTLEKPVGTVWISLGNSNQILARKFSFSGNREQIQAQTVTAAVDWLAESLK